MVLVLLMSNIAGVQAKVHALYSVIYVYCHHMSLV